MISPFDLSGFLGLGLFLFAYAMVNLGRWNERDFRFHLANFWGAILMLISLIGSWNLPIFVMEIFWAAIAGYGMWRVRKR
jgi:hypothetical protein